MNDPYVKTVKKIQYSALWKCHANTLKVFMWFLINAKYKDEPGHLRGTLCTTESAIGHGTFLSRRSVRQAIKNLVKCQTIAKRATRKQTFISILKYAYYQDPPGQQNAHKEANKEANRVGQQDLRSKTLLQEVKEDKKAVLPFSEITPEELTTIRIKNFGRFKHEALWPNGSTMDESDTRSTSDPI